jgi:diguanylate cyclase (GGDEF)-like protein/PAS domain S-box-containing protein
MKSASDGMVIVDSETLAVVDANTAFADSLGCGLDEVRRMHVWDWDARWSRAQLVKLFASRNNRNYIFETRHRHKDGTVANVWVSTTEVPWRGRLLVFCLVRNIGERMRREINLERELAVWRFVLERINGGVVVLDAESFEVTDLNPAFADLLGYEPAQMIGMHPWDWDVCYTREQIQHPDLSKAGDHGELVLETRMRRKDGTLCDVEVTSIFMLLGERRHIFCICRDITERCAANKALLAREQEFRTLAENAPDPIVRYDRSLCCVYVNPAFARLFDETKDDLLGKPLPSKESTLDLATFQAVLEHAFLTGSQQETEVRHKFADGSVGRYHVRFEPEFEQEQTVHSVLAVFRDISDLVKQKELAERLAYNDVLTGLPNRVLFEKRFRAAADRARMSGAPFVLMMLDIDHFKDVNDSLGHNTGDELLRQAAGRLSRSLRESDTIGRMGGDEFAILQTRVRSMAEAVVVAERILGTLAQPFTIDGYELFVSASMGIAFFPLDSEDLGELFTFADTAMYSAKRKGRNNFQFYTRELTRHASERLSLGVALRHACDGSDLELFYQPKVRMEDGRIVGMEALLRWHHPELGLVTPDRFIGIAEETGLIIEIGKWVLKTACRAAVRFNRHGAAPCKVAVNLSSRQFIGHDLIATVSEALHATGCRGEWLEFEITESIMIDDNPRVRRVLEAFQILGITIAIDDFGTGYSALNYLSRFPIDVLKIDRSFVRGIDSDSRKAGLVNVFMSLGKALNLEIVAEGVETEAEAAALQQLGCVLSQGYLYGRPMPFEDIEQAVPVS